MDFAEFRLPWGKRHALIMALDHSGHKRLQYYERQAMGLVMLGLEERSAISAVCPPRSWSTR